MTEHLPSPEALPVGAALLSEGCLVEVNPPFCSLLGHGPEELVGCELGSLLAPEDRVELASRLAATDEGWFEVAGAAADGRPIVVSLRIGPGGEVVVAQPAGAPILAGDQGTASDEQVRRGEWETAGIDRVLSHDVRGALRGVSSFLALLRREAGDTLTGTGQEYFETAAAAAARADVMVERIVHFLRLSLRPLQLTPTQLDDIVARAVDESSLMFAGEPARLEVGSLPTVWGDPGLLVECFAELLTNARKFADGPVNVGIAADATSEGWVYVDLVDDGPGVDPAFAEDAFQLFRLLQPKGRYPGIGVGLALCRQIVRVHGGRCWIVEDEQPGTRVRLRLRAAPAPASPGHSGRVS